MKARKFTQAIGAACAIIGFAVFAFSAAGNAQSAGCNGAASQSFGVRVTEESGRHLLAAKLGSMTEWSLVVQSAGPLASPVVSNDGEKLAYLAEEFGRWRAFLQRLETGYRVEVAVFAEMPARICFDDHGESLIVEGIGDEMNLIPINNAWSSLN